MKRSERGLRSPFYTVGNCLLRSLVAGAKKAEPIDQLHLQRLKKRKLALKDEIAWLESRLIPDSIA